jgi:alkylation response protein AidB-like acyl-CoA dehydrogenase
MYDATRAVDDVEFDDVPVDDSEVLAVGETAAVLADRMLDRAAVALAADSLGVADQALALTVDYTRTRHQFRRAIGSFQAVKHQLADRYIELAAAQSLLDAAARDVTRATPDAGVMASAAKAVCCETATRTIGTAIQLHGAIGYTWEYDLHLLMKRAVLNEMLLGTVRWHRDRVGAQLPDRQHP